MPQFAALMLDLDGTLVDSEPCHFQAHRQFLATKGITVSEDELTGNIGKGDEVFYQAIAAKRGLTIDVKAWVDAKAQALLSIYKRGLPARPGVQRLLDHASAEGICPCVVTNSERHVAKAALTAAGLASRLPIRVCREDTPLHKPDPAPYLLAARRLGVPSDRCIAIEDSESGVRSAAGALMTVIGLAGMVPAAKLVTAGAAHILRDLADAVPLSAVARRSDSSRRARA